MVYHISAANTDMGGLIVAKPWRILRNTMVLAGIILLIFAAIVVFWGNSLFGPPHGYISSVQKDSNTTLNFTFEQPDKATPFSDCLLDFWVDAQPGNIRPIQTGIDHPMILSYSVHPNRTYAIVVHDQNDNGRMDAGDYVTVTCSSSLATDEWYRLGIVWAGTDTFICRAAYHNL